MYLNKMFYSLSENFKDYRMTVFYYILQYCDAYPTVCKDLFDAYTNLSKVFLSSCIPALKNESDYYPACMVWLPSWI